MIRSLLLPAIDIALACLGLVRCDRLVALHEASRAYHDALYEAGRARVAEMAHRRAREEAENEVRRLRAERGRVDR